MQEYKNTRIQKTTKTLKHNKQQNNNHFGITKTLNKHPKHQEAQYRRLLNKYNKKNQKYTTQKNKMTKINRNNIITKLFTKYNNKYKGVIGKYAKHKNSHNVQKHAQINTRKVIIKQNK